MMGAGFVGGTVGIFVKFTYSATTIGPLSLVWVRLIFALALVGSFARVKHCEFDFTPREITLFAVFGLCGFAVMQSLFYTSFAYTSVAHTVALLYTAPAFVAILSKIFLKERLTRDKIIAVLMSILGACLILGLARGEQLFASRTQIGDWLGLASGLAYSSWYIFGKILGTNQDPAVTSLVAMCFGFLFMLPLVVLLEGVHVPHDVTGWSLVAATGISTGIAYLLYFSGLKLIDATRASVFAIVEPLSAAVLAFLFLQEILSLDSFLGFGLIIASIVLTSRKMTDS